MLFKSKTQLDTERQFTLLPQDDYELIVVDMKPDIRQKYQAKPDKDGNIPSEEIINVLLNIVTCKDGSLAVDDEGKDAAGRKVFFTGRPQSMGFMRDGTPSKTRCFVAYATGQDVNGELELNDWNDLIGKTLFAEIIQKQNQQGQLRNAISRFITPKKPNPKKEL